MSRRTLIPQAVLALLIAAALTLPVLAAVEDLPGMDTAANMKEWLKLTCWDGEGVGEISIWAHDLEGNQEEGIIGYRSLIVPNKVYCALVQSDGERPISLARRKDYKTGHGEVRPTLFLKENI